MKLELTRLEADLIVYALINMNHLHDNNEFKSSFISAYKDMVKSLIKEVNDGRNEYYGEEDKFVWSERKGGWIEVKAD
jgi:hypothetical protein